LSARKASKGKRKHEEVGPSVALSQPLLTDGLEVKTKEDVHAYSTAQ
jgi:hypothetical protein